MNTSFKEYCRRRLDEAQQFNPFLRAMVQMVQDSAKQHPFWAAIAADPQKFEEWLNFVPDILAAMTPEEHKRIASEPRGITILLNPMMQRMIQAHPEMAQLMNASDYASLSPSGPSQGQASVQTARPMQTQRPEQQRQPSLQVQNPKQQQPNDPQQHLISLATQLATRLGRPPLAYVDDLKGVMAKNPQRIAAWASQIRTPEDMLAKFNDWKRRGVI